MAKTILLVEDEELVAGYLQKGLELQGYDVLLEREVEGAQQCLMRKGQELQYLVTDGLGKDSGPGLKLAELARQLNPEIAVLLISGNPPPSANDEEGPVRFVQKPFTCRQLVEAMREMRE